MLLIVLGSITQLHAQLNARVIGSAINQGNNCYTITPDQFDQAGGVWYDNPIDFDSDFTIYYQNIFGNKDVNGADGMALVFKGNSTPVIGGAGGGIGYAGITPSLVIEFDTYQNDDSLVGFNGDPTFDHIAIMRDGIPNHNNAFSNLAGPIQASISSPNIEDGIGHEVKIVWNATTKVLSVFFDCSLRLTLNLDVKLTIFSGDDTVHFGFVGSTGGLSNLHQVCFNSISFVDNLQLQDETICAGNSTNVDATIPSGNTYSWIPTTGVSNPNSPNPILSPTTTTTYTVTISDVCGETTTEDITITVLPVINPIFDSVPAICEGDVLNELPSISNNGFSGTWTPAINNLVTTSYTFIPDDPCVTNTNLEIEVIPLELPEFDAIDAICEGDILRPLPTISNDGISGSWSPALNNLATTIYTFIPDFGQDCAQEVTLEIVVNPLIDPIFDVVDTICEGGNIEPLPSISNNGISGSWSPALNNTASTTYTFTPNSGQCAITTSLLIEVEPNIVPSFNQIPSICAGDDLEELPTTSLNGIVGTWFPELNSTESTTYTFVPNTNQCAITADLTIEVIPNEIPVFDAFGPICPGQFIDELPTISNNGFSGSWSPEINNFQTTTYTFFPDLGQGCVDVAITEIIVTDPIVPVFNEIEPICIGDFTPNLPLVSLDGIVGLWTPTLNNLETTTYTFTPNPGQCAIAVTQTIEVIPVSELSMEVEIVSEPFAQNQTVIATVSGGTGDYEYQLDNGSWLLKNVFNYVSGCEEHVIRVRETSSCSNVASETFRILQFPKFFTPNGDSNNPLWNITCLDDQPNTRISIFDRYGKILTTISPSGIGWDGTYSGNVMPTSDYWFKVDYFAEDGSPKSFTSHFTLKR